MKSQALKCNIKTVRGLYISYRVGLIIVLIPLEPVNNGHIIRVFTNQSH